MDNQTADPNVFVNKPPVTGAPAAPPPPAGGVSKWLTPKNFFIVLGIVIVIELILAIKVISSRSSQSTQAPGGLVGQISSTGPTKGSIVLTAGKKEVAVGEVVAVSLEVTSSLPSDGIDAVLNFDPKLLQVQDTDIEEGIIFPLYPLVKADPSGVVRISGITTPGSGGFSGRDIFATVNFKALKQGVTKVTVEFEPGQTADSNIVGSQGGGDLLEEVGSLEISIK